jgi:hypothetical protein
MVGLILAAVSLAQEATPKPAPELKKLDLLTGSWLLEGDVKPSSMGSGGKVTEKEDCVWMDGGFFLVCHVDFKSANSGSGTGLSLLGYSTSDKLYTYREFNSWGEFEDSKGTIDGDTWTWNSADKMGDTVVKARFTMKFTSPLSYTFSYETTADGTKWTTLVDGKATKK